MVQFELTDVTAVDLARPSHPINTGVGYLDHMIDQLNSHAQVGVSVTVRRHGNAGSAADLTDRNRHADPPAQQAELMSTVGTALGREIGEIVRSMELPAGRTSRFCCPLDEALVECELTVPPCASNREVGVGSLAEFSLPPYGVYPCPGGRTRVGRMVVANLGPFFASLAASMGLTVALRKVRGDNGHHVVESAFKAFSRSLRNLLDGTDTAWRAASSEAYEVLWGVGSEGYRIGLDMARSAALSRSTKETSIDVDLRLDGMSSGVSVSTGVNTLDAIIGKLAREARIGLNVKCEGDTWVDDHHTSEDVAIAVGQCLNTALGTKAGLNRMWCASAQEGRAVVEVTVDLSNRPCLTHDLSLSENAGDEEYAGDMSVEMVDHALHSLVMNGQMTVHVVEVESGAKVLDTAMATVAAFGRALRLCLAVDPRRAGKTASSKGTLSV